MRLKCNDTTYYLQIIQIDEPRKLDDVEVYAILYRRIFWLYTGSFTGWWLYDLDNMNKLDKIFKDFNKPINNMDDLSKINNLIKFHNGSDIKTINDNEKRYEFVAFEEDDMIVDDGPINYNIVIGTEEYRIDLNLMKQFNIKNPINQRGIHRLDLGHLSKEDKFKKLISFGAKGINGKVFM